MVDIEKVLDILTEIKMLHIDDNKAMLVSDIVNGIDNAIQTIRELRSNAKQESDDVCVQNKWHYCKDELPPKRQDILVVLRDGEMSTGHLSDEYFYVDCMSKKYVEIKNVIAWRELPKFEEVE